MSEENVHGIGLEQLKEILGDQSLTEKSIVVEINEEGLIRGVVPLINGRRDRSIYLPIGGSVGKVQEEEATPGFNRVVAVGSEWGYDSQYVVGHPAHEARFVEVARGLGYEPEKRG